MFASLSILLDRAESEAQRRAAFRGKAGRPGGGTPKPALTHHGAENAMGGYPYIATAGPPCPTRRTSQCPKDAARRR